MNFNQQLFSTQAGLIALAGKTAQPSILQFVVPKSKFKLACDGAVDDYNRLKFDFIIGDLDSIRPDSLSNHSSKIIKQKQQDTTDFHKALNYIKLKGINIIHVLGGTGGRLDHLYHNLRLLKYAFMNDIKIFFWGDSEIILIFNDELVIDNSQPIRISFFAFDEKASGITTTGLKYNLTDFEFNNHDLKDLNASISNQIVASQAKITVKVGILILFIEYKYILNLHNIS